MVKITLKQVNSMSEWLNIQDIAINKHLKNIFESCGLSENWLFPFWKQPVNMNQRKTNLKKNIFITYILFSQLDM